jgi:hypothetical protein
VIGVSKTEADLLLRTTPMVLVVVMEPLELVDDQRKLIITKCLNLLHDRHKED